MAGTINYLYDPNQAVWVITTAQCDNAEILAVQSGKIIQVIGSVLSTVTTLTYQIRIDDTAGVSEYVEADVFPSLASATTEYEVRLT